MSDADKELAKSTREVTLSAATWEWLEAYARDRKMTVDEYISYCMRYFRMDTSRLTREVREVERIPQRPPLRIRPEPPTPRHDPRRKIG